jgi:hypothetical protein
MASPLPGDLRVFDLAGPVAYDRARRRLNGMIVGGVGVFLVGVGLAGIIASGFPATDNWVLAGVLWAIAAAMFGIGLRGDGPMLTRLALTSRGLSLEFEPGATMVLGWEDPRFGLTFQDYRGDRNVPPADQQYVRLYAARRLSGFIPRAAVGEIVARARATGLPVLTRREYVGEGKVRCLAVMTRIGLPEDTPGWRDAIPA